MKFWTALPHFAAAHVKNTNYFCNMPAGIPSYSQERINGKFFSSAGGYSEMEKQEFKDAWLPLSDGFYRVAYSILGTEQDAREALQDLYIRLWNKRNVVGKVRSRAAYGTRIIRNICIDRLRTRNAGVKTENIDDIPHPGNIEQEPAPDSIMIEREMLGILQKTVGTLPVLQKTVFEMKFYRQMSYDEIVRHTGLSYVNVRVLVSRARKAVESALKGFAD